MQHLMECSVDDNVCVNGVRSKSPVSVLYANNKQKDTNNGKGEHISKNQFDNNRDARANKAIRTFFRRNAPSFSCRSMFGRGKKNELFAKLARLMKIKLSSKATNNASSKKKISKRRSSSKKKVHRTHHKSSNAANREEEEFLPFIPMPTIIEETETEMEMIVHCCSNFCWPRASAAESIDDEYQTPCSSSFSSTGTTTSSCSSSNIERNIIDKQLTELEHSIKHFHFADADDCGAEDSEMLFNGRQTDEMISTEGNFYFYFNSQNQQRADQRAAEAGEQKQASRKLSPPNFEFRFRSTSFAEAV